MKNRQKQYGVIVKGCSGEELYYCTKRSTADRIRRVCRYWLWSGGWSGWSTLDNLVDLAVEMKGETVYNICAEFAKRGKLK